MTHVRRLRILRPIRALAPCSHKVYYGGPRGYDSVGRGCCELLGFDIWEEVGGARLEGVGRLEEGQMVQG